MNKIHLVIIDPQYDFCNPKGSLFVPGADKDMDNLTIMINRLGKKIDDIHVTLDSHHLVDIAHPIFWLDSQGKHPAPFTLVSAKDVNEGRFTTTNPSFLKRAKDYVNQLEANARYPLCIWPPHCLIGSQGYLVYESLFEALKGWELNNFAMVNFVTKGSNFWTEHYSVVQADVIDPNDPGTMLNTAFIQTLQEADIIAVAGEAKSHCVANSIVDISNNFGQENLSKFVLLEDCMSNVPGFEKLGEDFIREMKTKGMKISNSKEFLK